MRRAGQEQSRRAYVPERSFVNRYVQRDHDGVSDFDMLDYALENRKNVLAKGPTGTGKSLLWKAYAAHKRMRYAVLPCSLGLDPTHIAGKHLPNRNRTKALDPEYVWLDGVAADIIRNGGLLALGEVNFMPERIGPILFPTTDWRRSIRLQDHEDEEVFAHVPTIIAEDGKPDRCWCSDPDGKECRSKWVLVCADMNPDYEGTRPLNRAFKRRFSMQPYFDYDPVVEAQLVPSESLRELFQDKLRPRNDFTTAFSTDMMMDIVQLTQDKSFDFAMASFLWRVEGDEQQAVQIVVDPFKQRIETEIAALTPVVEVEEGDEPQGVHGVDWIYEDETLEEAQRAEGLIP